MNKSNITFKNNLITIPIDSLDYKMLKYSELFSSYQVIPLETSEECLISRIHQFDIYNEEFYVFDKNSGGIFVFNKQGDFIRKIGKKGKGRGEFIKPACISINKNKGEIACLDGKLKKIILFNTEGELIKEIRLKGSHIYFGMIADDDYIYFDVALTEARPNSKSLVYAIDYEGKPIWQWCPKGEPITELKIAGDYASPTLISNSEGFSLRRLYMNHIYSLNDKKMKPYIMLTTDNSLQSVDIAVLKKKGLRDVYNYTKERDMFIGINQFYESDSYVYMSFRSNLTYSILINKKSQKYVCFKPYIDDFAGTRSNFSTMIEDQFITCANDRVMSQLIEKENLNIVGPHEISPISNPAVVLYKLKDSLPYNEN